MAEGGGLLPFWRSMVPPHTSHLVRLFSPNKRKTEIHWSSADDRDGSRVGLHTHLHTHGARATDGRGPRYAAGAGAGPCGQAPAGLARGRLIGPIYGSDRL